MRKMELLTASGFIEEVELESLADKELAGGTPTPATPVISAITAITALTGLGFCPTSACTKSC